MEIKFIGFEGLPVEKLIEPFEDLINTLKDGLELEPLKYIIIPEDFKTELFKFQKSKGLREECTENEVGVAGGKVVSYVESGQLETCIFLHPATFGLLFSKEPNEVLYGIQIMRHELCHVHDEHLKSRVFSLDFITNQENDFEWALKMHADHIWSEYIANKLSKATVNLNGTEVNIPDQTSVEQDIKLFIESVFKVEADARKYIDAYRTHCDIDILYLQIQESSCFLLGMMGRIYGFIYSCDELLKIMNDFLKEVYAFEIWQPLCQSLDILDSKYPDWSGIQELEELGKVVLQTWNILGIYPIVKDNGEGLFISVPIRPPIAVSAARIMEQMDRLMGPAERIMRQYQTLKDATVYPIEKAMKQLQYSSKLSIELQQNLGDGNMARDLSEMLDSINEVAVEKYDDRKHIIELLESIDKTLKEVLIELKSK